MNSSLYRADGVHPSPATVRSSSNSQVSLLSLNSSNPPQPESVIADNSTHSTNCLKIAFLNIRSLSNKTFIVNDIIESNQLHCILLTETWLDDTGSKERIEASPSNFSFSHCIRPNKKVGGVAAIFSDILSCKTTSFGSYSTFEYLALITRSACHCLVLTLYCSPKLKNGFLSEFGELLKITVECTC